MPIPGRNPPPFLDRTAIRLLLYLKDVNGTVETPFYASVLRVGRTTVEFKAFCESEATVTSIQRTVAEPRRVSSQETTGKRPGAWLRKAVCF
ncbi:hypothetical protein JG687_00001963 [Phytophthora cactorum]|uniref:Uncharacterized protein n=1 Tax=Phytophthora cactorum TaxID=29920 RepID=A0A8T1UVX0_9STRA|nr:hypothetical protein JG687_00001963 [Phytophthora cactorum]